RLPLLGYRAGYRLTAGRSRFHVVAACQPCAQRNVRAVAQGREWRRLARRPACARPGLRGVPLHRPLSPSGVVRRTDNRLGIGYMVLAMLLMASVDAQT